MSDYRPNLFLLIWLALVAVMLPVIYILSFGPAYWLIANGFLSTAAFTAYAPLDWLAWLCPPFHDALDWYLGFWQ